MCPSTQIAEQRNLNGAELIAAFVFVLFVMVLSLPTATNYLFNSDIGMQLTFAREMQNGALHGTDFYLIYGPLVPLTSAIGLSLTNSFLGEALLSAFGYTLAIVLVYYLVGQHSSRIYSLSATFFSLLLLARFYKWWVWLFPLLTLLVMHLYITRPAGSRTRLMILGGAVTGINWLFRFDVGSSGLLAIICLVGFLEICSPERNVPRLIKRLGILIGVFCIPIAIWFLYLLFAGGPAACVDYLTSTIRGASMLSRGMGKSLPPMTSNYWLDPDNLLAVSYVLTGMTYVGCAGYGAWREWKGQGDSLSRMLLAGAIVGLSVFHQSLHRRDGWHLLQVIPPAIVCVHLVVFAALKAISGLDMNTRQGRLVRSGFLIYLVLVVVCGIGMMRWGRSDNGPFTLSPLQRMATLDDPLQSMSDHPIVNAMQEIRERTEPDDRILVYPRGAQYYVLADRRLSGMLHAYAPGVFSESPWRDRNMARVQDNMPALVVVQSDFFAPPTNDQDARHLGRRSHDYMEQFLKDNYLQVVYDDADIMLLRRPDPTTSNGSIEHWRHYTAALSLEARGQRSAAVAEYRRAIELFPDFGDAHRNLGIALATGGQTVEALEHLRTAVKLNPEPAKSLNALARILMAHPDPQIRDPLGAIRYAEQAARITDSRNPKILNTLAMTYAASGQFARALQISGIAYQLAYASKDADLVSEIGSRMQTYQQRLQAAGN